MKIKHTHRTNQIRSDYELAALVAICTFNHGRPATTEDVNDFEARFRGISEFEKTLRVLADWLALAAPTLEFEEHKCGGQLCDQDGLYDVAIVQRVSAEEGSVE